MTTMILLFSIWSWISCNSEDKKTTQPYLVEPFQDISYKEALAKASESKKQLLIFLPGSIDIMEMARKIGIIKEKPSSWHKQYIMVAFPLEHVEAEAVSNKYEVLLYPAVVRTQSDGTLPNVQYGSVFPENGPEINELRRSLSIQLLELFDEEKLTYNQLFQLISHIPSLPFNDLERDRIKIKVTNKVWSNSTFENYKSYEGYQLINRYYDDIRHEITELLFLNQPKLNSAWNSLKGTHRIKSVSSAEFFIIKALRRTYEKSVKYNDLQLFMEASKLHRQYLENYEDEWTLKAQLQFHIIQNNDKAACKYALAYYHSRKRWTIHTEQQIMLQSAEALYNTSDNVEDLSIALKWVMKAVKHCPSPDRWHLVYNLALKIEDTGTADRALQEMAHIKNLLIDFISLYRNENHNLSYDHQNINRDQFKKINRIDKRYFELYRYISLEGSLYKKDEKIEPIQLLAEDKDKVVLLSRVHLMTGSILPVTHVKSYYVKSEFNLEGSHLRSEYYTP